MPFISKRDLNKLLNKSYLEGYQLGLDSGRFEATIKRYSPNEMREILGLKPINTEGSDPKMKTEKWYQRRLSKYFTEHFEQYEDTAEFWNNPAENCWLFDIPELGQRIELVCRDNGVVEETRFKRLLL